MHSVIIYRLVVINLYNIINKFVLNLATRVYTLKVRELLFNLFNENNKKVLSTERIYKPEKLILS